LAAPFSRPPNEVSELSIHQWLAFTGQFILGLKAGAFLATT
jgi:hypothetical protein